MLETLAERIAGGVVADLVAQLPVELHPPLRRGAARTRHAAKMSVDDFVHRVAEREGISPERAREHVRAVFETLRETIDRPLRVPGHHSAVAGRVRDRRSTALTRHYGPVRAVLLGPVSRHIVAEAHCPVIVVARGGESRLELLVDEASSAGAPA